MEEKRYLTFALGKGRLAKKTLELFEKIGITCDEIRDPDTRKLIFVNEELGLRFFLAKGPDVPTYVEYGAADIRIVGKDTILEESRNIYEVLEQQKQTQKKLEEHIQVDDERNANLLRTQILRFNDELIDDKHHTREHFIEILAVIDAYEDYCRSHPDYKNNRCICAVANIKRVYNERLQKHDFS